MKTKNFPTHRKMVNSIIRAMHRASDQQIYDGADWYRDARKFAQELSLTHDIPLKISCGIISAMSANKHWKENKRITKIFLESGKVLHTFVMGMKATNILNGANIPRVLNGEKTKAFYFNILRPECVENVTIDRHAWRVAGLDASRLTTNQYKLVADAYFKATNEYNRKNNTSFTPCQIQAITWIVQRGKKD